MTPPRDKKNIPLEKANPYLGLSEAEAKRREALEYGNAIKEKGSRGIGKIISENLFTFFNVALYGIAVVFLIFSEVLYNTGYGDLVNRFFGLSRYGFLIPLTLNILIGIITEAKSKRTLDKLKILNEGKITVYRDGKAKSIPPREIVLGDVVELHSGDQIPADCTLLFGDAEVDESLLTGESDPVRKHVAGDLLYSGSFVSAGECRAEVVRVGKDSYAASLAKKVKSIDSEKSLLMRTIHGILNALSVVLVLVIGIVVATMAVKIHLHSGDPNIFPPSIFGEDFSLGNPAAWAQIISTASAYAIGVIPTGLVLVTSMSLSVSILKLSKEQTLVQELYSLENLSRVDVICLDKTGTLTSGDMLVKDVDYFGPKEDADSYLAAILSNTKTFNATMKALASAFPASPITVASSIPFSSARKYSGVVLLSGKEVLLGAPEYLLPESSPLLEEAKKKESEGLRVLALTYDGFPMAFYALQDEIRPSAKETIEYFYENGVDVKIISGDAPLTVSRIAETCGVRNAEKAISLEGKSIEETKALAENYTIFARVSPEQKEALVEALQEKKHKVAMTGDGVNDTLALRKANASITFARATNAAKACSDVVLLDNDFSHLESVVSQGRRVVNNIMRSAILFLTKTFFVILLCLVSIAFRAGQMFYTVEDVYLLQGAVIGIGGFLLSLENSKTPIEGTFREKVFPRAIAGGLLLLLFCLSPMIMWQTGVLSMNNVTTAMSVLTCFGGFLVMFDLCRPFNQYRRYVYLICWGVAIFFCLAMPTSYLGGLPTSMSMIFGDPSDPASMQFWHECFQPWNSSVYPQIASEPWIFACYGGAVLLGYPLYLLLKRVATFLFKAKWVKEKPLPDEQER